MELHLREMNDQELEEMSECEKTKERAWLEFSMAFLGMSKSIYMICSTKMPANRKIANRRVETQACRNRV